LNAHRAFDLSRYGYEDLVIMNRDEMAIIYTAATELTDRYQPDILACYMDTVADDLRILAGQDLVDEDWITRAMINIAVQGLLGRELPDAIDLED